MGPRLAAVSDRELYVYAFDSIAYPVEAAGPELSAWEKALTGITAGGNTSVGVVIYDVIEALAKAVGDEPTANLAARHRADEEKMLAELRGHIPRLDAGRVCVARVIRKR